MFNFNYLNQVYGGLSPNDTQVGDWIAKANAPAPVAPPVGSVVMPGQPVNVNAPTLAGVPAQFQAQPAPLPVPAGPPSIQRPQAQPAAFHPEPQPQGPAPGPGAAQDISIGVSAAPLRYETISTPGRAAGEVNVMAPGELALRKDAASLGAGVANRTADRVSGAMGEQRAPLDERAQYLTALAEREARDQGGRNEQNRQRLEDYEKEAKELRDMKPDPNAYLSSGGAYFDTLATVLGGIGQSFQKRAGDTTAENMGAKLAAGNRARFDAAQGQTIANKRGYLEDVRRGMLAQRDMQNDQVASNQRESALRKEATGAKLDKAGIGVAIQEAVSRGDMGEAQALIRLVEQRADKIKYAPAQGGGRTHYVKDPVTGAVMAMGDKEFNAHVKDISKDMRGTSSAIAINAAKADADGKGKKEEDLIKRFVPSVTGGPGQIYPTEAEAKKAREGNLAAAKAIETMEKAKALTNDMGVTGRAWDKIVPGGSAKGEQLRGLQGQAILALKDSENMGTLDTQAERMGQKVTGDFTKLFNPTATMDSYTQSVWDQIKRSERYNAGVVRPQIQQAAPSFKPVK